MLRNCTANNRNKLLLQIMMILHAPMLPSPGHPIQAHPTWRSLTPSLNLLQAPDPQLGDGQHREPVLTLHSLLPLLPLLALDLLPHRLTLDAQHGGFAFKQALVDERGAAEGQVAAAEDGGAGETQNGSRENAVHEEGEAHVVAGGDEVRVAVDVERRVVGGLSGKDGEQGADLLGEGLVEGLLRGVELMRRRCRRGGCRCRRRRRGWRVRMLGGVEARGGR